MRGRVYRGSPQSVALYQPFVGRRNLVEEGIVLGTKSDVADLAYLHPFNLPNDSTNIAGDGVKNAGKSAFAKSFALRCSMLQAYNVLGEPEYWRTRIISRKSEGGSAEYLPLLNAVGAKMVSLGKGKRINLIGLLRKPADQMNATINVVQEIGLVRNNPKISTSISIAIQQINELNPRMMGEAVIAEKLKGLDLTDFQKYFKDKRDAVRAMFKTEFEENPDLIWQLNMDGEDTAHVDASFLDAARFAAGCLDELMGPAFGDVFGGTDSLYDVLSMRFLVLDLEEMQENAFSLFDSVLMLAEASAIRYSKEDINTEWDMTKIIPSAGIRDEEGGAMAMGSLMHARATAIMQNKSRAYRRVEISLAQYEYQISEAGSVGTELRNLARQIDNGYDTRLIFRQANDEAILHRLSSKLQWSDEDVFSSTQLAPGEAFLWVRGQPAMRFQYLIFDEEEEYIYTNSSKARGGQTIPLWSQSETVRRLGLAEQHGVDLDTYQVGL